MIATVSESKSIAKGPWDTAPLVAGPGGKTVQPLATAGWGVAGGSKHKAGRQAGAVPIFNFVNCWNELFLSVTLLNSDSNKTVPTALNGFISSFIIDWGSMSAAAVFTIVPTMLLFAFASRHIVQGLTSGAVKG